MAFSPVNILEEDMSVESRIFERTSEGETVDSASTGLEIVDLRDDLSFLKRQLREHDSGFHVTAVKQISEVFEKRPGDVLNALVDAAVSLCGADSAGVSVRLADADAKDAYHWIATAGEYAGFVNATLPRHPSACGVCIERGHSQTFRVFQAFFDQMGLDAAVVTDGLLIPWKIDELQGTIWIMAHGRHEGFDVEDLRLMEILGTFTAIAVRQQRERRTLIDQAHTSALAAVAIEITKSLKEPVQTLAQVLAVAPPEDRDSVAAALARQITAEFCKLSTIVTDLTHVP